MSMPMEIITSGDQGSVVGGQSQDATNDEQLTTNILAENEFYWREKDGVTVLISRALEENGFVNGFSTRLGGVSDFPENSLNLAGFDEDSHENIFENRRRFLNVFDKDFKLATAWQVHSDDVKIVCDDAGVKNNEEKFDALVSD